MRMRYSTGRKNAKPLDNVMPLTCIGKKQLLRYFSRSTQGPPRKSLSSGLAPKVLVMRVFVWEDAEPMRPL